MSDRYVRMDDGTVWPVDVVADDGTSVQWRLRYAPETMTRDHQMLAASILDAYATLTSTAYPLSTADKMLRTARQARVRAS